MTKKLSERSKKILTIVLLSITFAILLYFFIFKFDTIKTFFSNLVTILMPFILGALFAFIIKPIANYWEVKFGEFFSKTIYRKKLANGRITQKKVHHKAETLSIIFAVLIFFIVVVGILLLVIPSLVNAIGTLTDNIPAYIDSVQTYFADLEDAQTDSGRLMYNVYTIIMKNIQEIDWDGLTQTLIAGSADLAKTVTSIISGTLSALVDVLVTVVSMIYILINRKKFGAQAKLITYAFFKDSTAEWIVKEAGFANQKFSEFFSGKLLDSIIVGIILYIILMIFSIPQALLIATFMAFCNMIPFFGPYIGAFPSTLIVLMSDIEHPFNAITFLIIVIIVQQLDGNILDPFIVGDNVGISSFWVLFAVMLFGDWFGFFGLIIGVPLFAVLYDIIRQLVYRKLEDRKKKDLIEEYTYIYHDPTEEEAAKKKRPQRIQEKRQKKRQEIQQKARETVEQELLVAQQYAEQHQQSVHTSMSFNELINGFFEEDEVPELQALPSSDTSTPDSLNPPSTPTPPEE